MYNAYQYGCHYWNNSWLITSYSIEYSIMILWSTPWHELFALLSVIKNPLVTQLITGTVGHTVGWWRAWLH